MKRVSFGVLGAWLVASVAASAQHAGHQPAQPPGGVDPPVVAACVQGQREASSIAAQAIRRIEAARQTNSAPAMRAAVDELQGALLAIQRALRACDPLGAAASPGDPHTDHASGTAVPALPGAEPAAAIDPVCGMKVDPKTAPKADYEGRTHYFCSEADRERFLKDPGKYVKKDG